MRKLLNRYLPFGYIDVIISYVKQYINYMLRGSFIIFLVFGVAYLISQVLLNVPPIYLIFALYVFILFPFVGWITKYLFDYVEHWFKNRG